MVDTGKIPSEDENAERYKKEDDESWVYKDFGIRIKNSLKNYFIQIQECSSS